MGSGPTGPELSVRGPWRPTRRTRIFVRRPYPKGPGVSFPPVSGRYRDHDRTRVVLGVITPYTTKAHYDRINCGRCNAVRVENPSRRPLSMSTPAPIHDSSLVGVGLATTPRAPGTRVLREPSREGGKGCGLPYPHPGVSGLHSVHTRVECDPPRSRESYTSSVPWGLSSLGPTRGSVRRGIPGGGLRLLHPDRTERPVHPEQVGVFVVPSGTYTFSSSLGVLLRRPRLEGSGQPLRPGGPPSRARTGPATRRAGGSRRRGGHGWTRGRLGRAGGRLRPSSRQGPPSSPAGRGAGGRRARRLRRRWDRARSGTGARPRTQGEA